MMMEGAGQRDQTLDSALAVPWREVVPAVVDELPRDVDPPSVGPGHDCFAVRPALTNQRSRYVVRPRETVPVAYRHDTLVDSPYRWEISSIYAQ